MHAFGFWAIILSPPPTQTKVEKPQDYPSEIKVGRDGLIIERSYYKGLVLLPVPVEWSWDKEEFLCQCCLKAGLPPDCWLAKGTRISKFGSVIAQEITSTGDIVIKDMQEGPLFPRRWLREPVGRRCR